MESGHPPKQFTQHFDGKEYYFPGKSFHPSLLAILKWKMTGKRHPWPTKIPHNPCRQPTCAPPSSLRITYIGHATTLIQCDTLCILTDPQFSIRTGPFGLGPKRVQAPGIPIKKLPKIDYIFISHNHYDHLDMPSLRQIFQRDHPVIICPLGNEKILQSIHPQTVVKAADWYESIPLAAEGETDRIVGCRPGGYIDFSLGAQVAP